MTLSAAKHNTSFYLRLLFFAGVWVMLFVFFFVVHPLIIYDTDDWNNSSYLRRALPIWGYFNPTKILPETLMASVADVGAFVFYPISHDYIRSLSLSYALVVGTCITLFVWAFYRFFVFLSGNRNLSCLLSGILLLFHFLIFKNSTNSNTYLLYAKDVTCYFHYIIPDLLCAGLVLFFMRQEDAQIVAWWQQAGVHPLRTGVAVLVLYLAINSNILSTIILASYAFVRFVEAFRAGGTARVGKPDGRTGKPDGEIGRSDGRTGGADEGTGSRLSLKKKGTRIKHFPSGAIFWLCLLCLWFCTLIFEMNGGRAGDIEVAGSSFISEVGADFRVLLAAFLGVNRMMLLICSLFLIAALGIHLVQHKRSRYGQRFVELVCCGILTAVYDVLVSAKAGGSYMARSDVLFGVFFYVLLFAGLLILDTVQNWTISGAVLPLILFVVFIQTINASKPFKEANMYNLPYETVLAVDQDILDQVIKADQTGQDTVTIRLPQNHSEVMNDWAYKEFSGQIIADTLYYHGVISRRLQATAVLDPQMNTEYGILYSEQ